MLQNFKPGVWNVVPLVWVVCSRHDQTLNLNRKTAVDDFANARRQTMRLER
jgi:hypothetical protein